LSVVSFQAQLFLESSEGSLHLLQHPVCPKQRRGERYGDLVWTFSLRDTPVCVVKETRKRDLSRRDAAVVPFGRLCQLAQVLEECFGSFPAQALPVSMGH
jgi:hypothetical protein